MHVISYLTRGVATATLAACLAGNAAAADAAANAPPPAAAQPSDVIGTVIVTAQRREERLQNVPVSVTAVGSEQIKQLFIHNLAGLTNISPNFTIQGVVLPQHKAVAGSYSVHAELRYQACDNSACYPPKKVPVSFNVQIRKSPVSH